MFLKLLKLPWSAFRHGEIHGEPVTRNPIAWIPVFLALPVVLVVWLLLIIGYVVLMPFLLVLGGFAWHSYRRKAGVFSETGIYFPKAYGRRTIAWSEVREVVREREPKASFYRIVCGVVPEEREYVMSSTPDNEAFERTLQERRIPFRANDRLAATPEG